MAQSVTSLLRLVKKTQPQLEKLSVEGEKSGYAMVMNTLPPPPRPRSSEPQAPSVYSDLMTAVCETSRLGVPPPPPTMRMVGEGLAPEDWRLIKNLLLVGLCFGGTVWDFLLFKAFVYRHAVVFLELIQEIPWPAVRSLCLAIVESVL
jgi:hypothetical protein